MIDPLLRRAPGFVRRSPGWALAVCLSTAAFALATATPPLVADAAADRSFVAEVDAAAGSLPGRSLDGRAATAGLVKDSGVVAVNALLDDLAVYGTPTTRVTPLAPYTDANGPLPKIIGPDGTDEIAIVASFDGALPDPPSDAGGPTIWVPDTTADDLGVAVGDTVKVALERPLATGDNIVPPVEVTIAGVYPTVDGVPTLKGVDWAALPGGLPDDPVASGKPARLLLTDRATALALIVQMGDTSLTTWDLPWLDTVDIEHGRDAADGIEEADLLLRNGDSDIGRIIVDAGGDPMSLNSGVGSFVERSERAAAELQPLVAAIGVTAQVMSALVLAVGTWLLTRNRRREHQLSMSMGIHPVRLAVTTAVELSLALVAGGALAFAIVKWRTSLVAGEGTIDLRTMHDATGVVVRAALLAVAVVVVAAFSAVWPLEPSSAGRARRLAAAVHADTVVVVAAIATGAQLLSQRGRALDSGTSLLFPLFAVLAGAVIVVRSATAIARVVAIRRRRSPSGRAARRPRSLAWWLAARRATSWLGELSALVIVVAAGVGLSVYGTSIATNGERGIDDKAAALGGATATVPIISTEKMAMGSRGLPTGLPHGWTVLWKTTDLHVGPKLVTDLLIVDPATFADAAAWRPSFSSTPLPELLASIDDGNAKTVDVVLAGNYTDTFPDDGVMELDRAFVRYRVVARIAAAPWMRERSSMMIVSANRFAGALPVDPQIDPPLTPSQELDKRFRTFVWADEPAAGVAARLGPVVLDTETIDTVTAQRTPAFVAFDMSLPYLRLVGAGLLVVALVAIVVLGARRRSDLAMEIAMTDRMGIRRGTMATAVAGGAVLLGLIGSAIGIGMAHLLVRFMIQRLDPGPSFAPGFAGGLSGRAVLFATGAVVVVSLLGALVEVRSARRARVVEVLRAAE